MSKAGFWAPHSVWVPGSTQLGEFGRIVIGTGENQFIAQIEHEDIRVAFIQSTENRRVGLRGEDDGGFRFPDDARRAMVRERGFRAGDDLLPFVHKKDDEIIFGALLCRSVEAATRLEIFEYIEGYYNLHRKHSSLDYKTPTQFKSHINSLN